MTPEEYKVAITKLPLRPTNVPGTYMSTTDGQCYGVPTCEGFTEEQRARVYDILREKILGYG